MIGNIMALYFLKLTDKAYETKKLQLGSACEYLISAGSEGKARIIADARCRHDGENHGLWLKRPMASVINVTSLKTHGVIIAAYI